MTVPDPLLAPLLDDAGDVLGALEAGSVPPALRKLAGFDRRGRRTPAAHRQLRRAVEADGPFRDAVNAVFTERPEVGAVLGSWSAAEVLARVGAAAGAGDLPLLASALWAARPEGWELGLGAIVATAARARAERDDEQELEAVRAQLASAEQVRRRADDARLAAETERARLEREQRDERKARRRDEVQATRDSVDLRKRAEQAEAGAARARAALAKAEAEAQRERDRAKAAADDARATRAELRGQGTAGPAGAPADRDPGVDAEALAVAADRAATLARELRALADRAGLARAAAPRRDPVRPAAAPPSRSRPGPESRGRRVPPRVPPGMVADSPSALDAMLRIQGTVLVVDGYNVTMRGWADADLPAQRERLIAALEALHLRTHAVSTVVFDGADVEGGPRRRPRGVQVLFSPSGQDADHLIVQTISQLPPSVPVVVASSDGWVRTQVEQQGACPVSADVLLAVLRRA